MMPLACALGEENVATFLILKLFPRELQDENHDQIKCTDDNINSSMQIDDLASSLAQQILGRCYPLFRKRQSLGPQINRFNSTQRPWVGGFTRKGRGTICYMYESLRICWPSSTVPPC
ncbi:unnamed protein product [Triticum turgidum subsp. durum]|uniref:Uncharacterized protein n=1 Tax=Triticum turgidum subsp. durum TaxID=4567 RepID=A0A9R1NSL1_TRITD|nr:unnamed protein product [Triticum turgidum subsp. durum]